MSLRIRYHTGSPTVQSAVSFVGTIYRGYHDSDRGWLGYIVAQSDLLGLSFNPFACLEHMDLLDSPRSVGSIFSLILPGKSSEESFSLSTQPIEGHRLGDSYDFNAYGNILEGIKIFGSVLSGRSFTSPSPANERYVRHDTFSGELIAGQLNFPSVSIPSDYGIGQISDAISYAPCHFRKIKVTNLDPFEFELMLTDNFDEVDLYYFLDHIRGKTVTYFHWMNGAYVRSVLTNVTYEHSSSELLIKYDMFADYTYGTYQFVQWKGTIQVPLSTPGCSVEPTLDGIYEPLLGEQIIWKYDILAHQGPDQGNWHSTMPFGSVDDFKVCRIGMSIPLSPNVDAEHDKCFNFLVKLPLYKLSDSFRDNVRKSWRDVIPSAMFSTVDAFMEAEGSLNTNVLQNLQKLPEVANMIPHLKEGVDVLGRLLRRDLSLSTIKEIADLSTSTILQGSFEWRPYYEIFTVYLPKMMSTLHSIGDIQQNAIGRGSFTFKISNDLGRKEVTLQTRTKLVMDASPSGLLSAITGLDALGLLPKASNLWDLIPFSFVANWFTGVGAALRRCEYSLFIGTIPSYFVHSYTLTSPLTEEELDTMEASNSLISPASLKLYYRDVSLYSPVPRDSRFGFGMPRGLPPLATLGSLLYQWIFH